MIDGCPTSRSTGPLAHIRSPRPVNAGVGRASGASNHVDDPRQRWIGDWKQAAMMLVGTWLATAAALLLFLGPLATAQDSREGKLARVGILAIGARDTAVGREDFRQALRDHGWVDGQNIVIEERWAEGKVERLANLAAELVRLKVDVIMAPNDPTALAAKNATTTIPIVMIASDDPVRSGLVASLARPGGNITGLSRIPEVAISGKQLQFLTTCFPNPSRVALLVPSAR